jgi:hypothetical protein
MQDSEVLIATMLLERFLDKSYTSNAYKVQVYIKPGTLSRRLDEGQKLFIHLLLPERVVRNNRQAREGGGPGGKRKAAGGHPIKSISHGTGGTGGDGSEEEEEEDEGADEDIVVDYGGEDEEGEGQPESSSAAKRRRRSSNQHRHHQSSSWVPSAAALDFDSDVGGNQQEALVADAESEWEVEDVEWKGNLRGAPAVTHRATLRSSGSSAQRKAAVVSGASALLDEVIDISSD